MTEPADACAYIYIHTLLLFVLVCYQDVDSLHSTARETSSDAITHGDHKHRPGRTGVHGANVEVRWLAR